jgi:hypothetical protein
LPPVYGDRMLHWNLTCCLFLKWGNTVELKCNVHNAELVYALWHFTVRPNAWLNRSLAHIAPNMYRTSTPDARKQPRTVVRMTPTE